MRSAGSLGGRTAIFVALIGTVVGFIVGTVGRPSVRVSSWLGWTRYSGERPTWRWRSRRSCSALLLLGAFGSSISVVVIAIAITTAPGVTRIARAASFEQVDLPYVEAARARGESLAYVTARELLPNIRRPLLVDFGLRLTGSILLVAALSFLGLGIRPPDADWGLMIGENRVGLTVQPWPVVLPVIAIAFITIGINLVLDGYRRRSSTWHTASATETTRVV